MKKTLMDIDGALTAQHATDTRTRLDKGTETTFGLFQKQDGRISMGSKVVRLGVNAKNSLVDDTEYKLTPGLLVLITNKHPRPEQWKTNGYIVYKSLVAQTKVKSLPNRAGTARPHAAWKWKHMIRNMVIPGERIADEGESEDTDSTDSVESYPDIASTGYSDISNVDYNSRPVILTSDSDILSPGPSIPSPTRSFYKDYGVVYLPGDINELKKKLHLLAQTSLQATPQSGTNWFMYWMHCSDRNN